MKNYSKWLGVKKRIEAKKLPPLFHEMEIWWCVLGLNIGVEEDGKNDLFERPVLVFRKFNREMFWGLPLTSKVRENIYYFPVKLHNREGSVILSQIKILSSKRLIRKMGKITDPQFIEIEKRIIELIKTNPLRGSRVPSGNL